MAIVCSQCGKELPREDARFCTNCGTLVPDHPLSPQTRTAAKHETPAHYLPEQVAQQPGDAKKPDTTNVTPWLGIEGHDGSNMTPWLGFEKYDIPDVAPVPTQEQRDPVVSTAQNEGEPTAEKSSEPGPGRKAESPIPAKPTTGPISNPGIPSGSRRLGGARTTRKSGDALPKNIAWPEPMTHMVTADNKSSARQDAAQNDFPILPSTPPPARDLHVKVWDEETRAELPVASGSASSAPAVQKQQEEDVEYLPTGPLDAHVATASAAPVSSFPDLPTTPISSAAAQEQLKQHEQKRERVSPLPEIDQLPTAQWQVQGVKEAAAVPVVSPPVQQRAEPAVPPVPAAYASRNKKRTLLISAAALLVIMLIAIGIWIGVAQPFALSADTNPVQTASNTAIGSTITYPAGWGAKNTSTSATLADSSNTAQIVLAQAQAADPAKYLQQQATTLGMTGAKAGNPVTFAGQNWQQISGDFQLSGASYTGTIYATMYNNHLYTWKQIAPKNVFQDEEKLVFAPARASLHLR